MFARNLSSAHNTFAPQPRLGTPKQINIDRESKSEPRDVRYQILRAAYPYPIPTLLLLLEHVTVASALLGCPSARQAPKLSLIVHDVAQAPLQEADARRKRDPQRKRHPHRGQVAAHNFTDLQSSHDKNDRTASIEVRFQTPC